MKVVFLDFDGVLTSRATGYKYGDPGCVAALNRLLLITGASIVVSSTWRMEGLVAVKKLLFIWGVAKEPIDITPRLRNENATRGSEIKQWLVEHPVVSQFIILDDDTDMDDLRDHLIKCDTELGLTQPIAERAIQRLL